MDSFTRSLVEHGAETTERDITWLDGLIAMERRSPQPNPPATPNRNVSEEPLSSIQEGTST
jgi:hypothetical protein